MIATIEQSSMIRVHHKDGPLPRRLSGPARRDPRPKGQPMTQPEQPASIALREIADTYQRQADEAWNLYCSKTRLALHYRKHADEEERHERRVAAVGDALRKVG